jgi:hypothetical protein
MTAARITHRQHAEPAPRRDVIGWLLLTGIRWTDGRPWFGFVGMAVTGLVFGVIKWRFL